MLAKEIIQMAQSGDYEALLHVLKEIEEPLYQTAFYLLGSAVEAKKVTQIALLKIRKHLPIYILESDFSVWSQRFVVTVGIHTIRKQKRTLRPGKEAKLPDLLYALTDIERAIIILRYVQRFHYREIAETLGVSRQTVKYHLFRARQRLLFWLENSRRGQEEGVTEWNGRK